MKLDVEGIKKVIPHRDPMLLLTTIENITSVEENKMEGTKVVATFFVSPQMEIFKGHFPDSPILPGIYQIEMMAQCSCFLASNDLENRSNAKTILLGVDNARFKGAVYPGMTLEIVSECLKYKKLGDGFMIRAKSYILNEGKLMSECEIMASVGGKL